MQAPEFTRYARDAAATIGATFEDLDGGGGYLYRVSRGGRSVLGGGGGVCAYPINSATAYTISRDKAHTKSVLRASGVPVIPGGLFFAHRFRAALRGPGREASDAAAFAEARGYPVFCKPNLGSRGDFAEIIDNADALLAYAARIAPQYESFLIEPVMAGREHRVLVKDATALFCSTKAEPEIIGDGRSTSAALVDALNARLAANGVSPVSAAGLGLAPEVILAAGERMRLSGRRNLSAQGGITMGSSEIPAPLERLAVTAAQAIGLRIGAVDLFDLSSAGDFTDLVVIEVNGNPGLRTLELAGRTDLINRLWVAMFEEALSGKAVGS